MTDKSTYSVTFALIFIAFCCVFCAFINLLCAKRHLAIMQRSVYKLSGYFSWLFKKGKRRILKRIYLSLAQTLVVLCSALSTAKLNFSPFLTGGIYIALCASALFFGCREKSKTPFVYTSRGKRLFAAFTVLLTAFSLAFGTLSLPFKGLKSIYYLSL